MIMTQAHKRKKTVTIELADKQYVEYIDAEVYHQAINLSKKADIRSYIQ